MVDNEQSHATTLFRSAHSSNLPSELVAIDVGDLPDEALWYLSKSCQLCKARALYVRTCSRCRWVHYCSDAHEQEHAEYHSQVCTLPDDVSSRGQTISEMNEERMLLAELGRTTLLPRGRLRASQQRLLSDWSQWFFSRNLKVVDLSTMTSALT